MNRQEAHAAAGLLNSLFNELSVRNGGPVMGATEEEVRPGSDDWRPSVYVDPDIYIKKQAHWDRKIREILEANNGTMLKMKLELGC